MQPTKTNEALCHEALQSLFGEMSPAQLQHMLDKTSLLEFEAGQYVFEQGQPGNTFYIALTGRFRALQDTDEGIYILGDISAGEPIGEISLFTREPHSASVIALRRSSVLKLEDDDYHELVQLFPAFASSLTRFVIERMRRNALHKKMDGAPKNIAVVNLQHGNDVSAYTSAIEQQLLAMGLQIRIWDASAYSEEHYKETFDNMEKQAGLNFLVCDAQHPEWANQCIAYCDLVIVATGFHESSDLYPIEQQLDLYSKHFLNKKIYLLLLHEENAPMPVNTRRWFTGRHFDLHIHLRSGHAGDIRRFCRIVTHQATGLVLGGGGARGFAHAGVLKALLEAGIEIDFVGGTSAGAIYGTAFTHSDFDQERILALCQEAAERKLTSNDFTFPFVSLMSGKKFRRFLDKMYGETYLEDLWVNTFTVSTNFSDASLKIHEYGLTRQQVEASMAIPGVFPPVIINKQLHIDGGVLDNLPVEAMYKKPVRNVIAVSLSAEEHASVDLKEVPSSWQLFWNKMKRSGNADIPGLSSILVNSITINSRHKQEAVKSHVSLFIELDLRQYKFLDWKHWRELIDKGYEQAKKQLAVGSL